MRAAKKLAMIAALGGTGRRPIPFGTPVVMIGDSQIVAEFNYVAGNNGGTSWVAGGPFSWANTELGTPFQFSAASQKGINSDQVDSVDARFVTDTAGFSIVYLCAGMADLRNSRTAAQCEVNFTSIFAKAKAAGQTLIIRVPRPMTVLTAPQEAERVALVTWLLGQAGRAIYVVPVPSNFDPAVHTWDGVHPNTQGGMKDSVSIQATIGPFITSGSVLFQSASDPANISTNGFLAVTNGGGVLGTNAFGQVAGNGAFAVGNYIVDGGGSGGARTDCSVISGPFGNKQRLIISGAKTGTFSNIVFNPFAPTLTPAMGTTSIFDMALKVDLAAGSVGIQAITLQSFIYNSGQTTQSISNMLARRDGVDQLQNRAMSGVLRAPAQMTFDTPTQITWGLAIWLTDGSLSPSAQIDISQVGIRKVQ